MKNLLVVCLLFGSLLVFSESKTGQKTIVGGVHVLGEIVIAEEKPACTHTKKETAECENATDEQECSRTYETLFSVSGSPKDWVFSSSKKEVCRTVGSAHDDVYCSHVEQGTPETDCEEVAAGGGGGGVVVIGVPDFP